MAFQYLFSPSIRDNYFPTYRMKDWYLGNSWAGGIAMVYPNGRNQESSSESIAAYEGMPHMLLLQVWRNLIVPLIPFIIYDYILFSAIALYGKIMVRPIAVQSN